LLLLLLLLLLQLLLMIKNALSGQLSAYLICSRVPILVFEGWIFLV